MDVYPPTAAAGNSRCLVTFGGGGEIHGFFYPRIDFARNVHEGMFALYLHGHGPDPLAWCFGDCWEREQHFERHTNILLTRLRHRATDLTVEVTDLVAPGEHALVRQRRG